MGLIDLTVPSAIYIDDLPPDLRRGGTAAIAQSGSVTDAFVHAGTRIGWSRIISCGSEAVLDLCDHLAACLDDPATDSIVLFVEGFKRPERFLALADRALAEDKPVLAVKVGRSSQAQAAAIAHTGSLAGDARATEAALRAAGVVLFDDLDELMEGAALVSRARRLGRRVGQGRTGVITVSTGEGSLIADIAPQLGLDLPPIPDGAREAIAAALPTLSHVENPLDPWGATAEGGPIYRACFEAFVASGACERARPGPRLPYRSQPGEVALAVGSAPSSSPRPPAVPEVLPVFVSLTSGDVTPGRGQMDAAGGVPILSRHRARLRGHRAAGALGGGPRAARSPAVPVRSGWPRLAAQTPRYAARPTGESRVGPVTPLAMPERESLAAMRDAGLSVVEWAAVPIGHLDQMLPLALAAAERLGWPVALKVDAPGYAHKTDAGGVVLGVEDEASLKRALARLMPIASRGVLVEPMVRGGVEVILGARRDPQFGPIVLAGIGGVLAEVLDDVAVRLAPVTLEDAEEMLDELRGAPLLDGARGLPTIDRRALAAQIERLGHAMLANPRWLEVDLNPVIAGPAGAVAVDALLVTADPGGAADA
jgi:hypothetical protein